MTASEVTSRRNSPEAVPAAAPPAAREIRAPAKRPPRAVRVMPFAVTLAAAVLAALLGWAMWGAYMGTPWTRDATVRAYVVTMAPEVSGRIVELTVIDNKYIHKGDLLMVIDPTNYTIAVSQATAAVQQAQASVQNIDAQMIVQQAQIGVHKAQLDQARAVLVFADQQAARYQALAQNGSGSIQNAQQFASQLQQQKAAVQTAVENLNLAQQQVESLKAQRSSAEASLAQANAQLRQAQVNLRRTRILSPVNGYVTNLSAHIGDYLNVGVNAISLVDADSYWIDGYFEETNLAPIRLDDPAKIKLMGTARRCAATSRASPARSTCRMHSPTIKGSRPSTPFSPGSVSRSASRCASTWIKCHRA
jgi:multidrug resistance efflux pump